MTLMLDRPQPHIKEGRDIRSEVPSLAPRLPTRTSGCPAGHRLGRDRALPVYIDRGGGQSESLELGPGEQLSQLACIMGLLLPQVRLPREIDGVIAAEPGSHTVEHAQPLQYAE